MTRLQERFELEGSEFIPLEGLVPSGRPAGDQRIATTLILRAGRRGPTLEEARAHAAAGLSLEQHQELYGSSADDAKKVADFAAAYGLEVTASHPERRLMVLSGTVAEMELAFGVTLEHFDGPIVRGFLGRLSLPASLRGVIEAVFGLEHVEASAAASVDPDGSGGWLAPGVARLYNFPPNAGTGQCIGLIELHGAGGAYVPSDLDTYFTSSEYLGFSSVPNVVDVSVGNGYNTKNPSRGECTLDISVAGAVAPGATIAVYFAPYSNGQSGKGDYVQALCAAYSDTTNRPTVVSSSYGYPQSTFSDSQLFAFEFVLLSFVSLGVTVCKASGDYGAYPGSGIKYPATSPSVLSCGGTYLTAPGGVRTETVWNSGNGSASGGGVSETFPLPTWQTSAGVPAATNGFVGRGAPDVGANASPSSGYVFCFQGKQVQIGGTSASAPLWAGLVALLNESLPSNVGFVNPDLYDFMNGDGFNQITSGYNGLTSSDPYSAGSGWNACTGLGTPDGANLLAYMQSLRASR